MLIYSDVWFIALEYRYVRFTCILAIRTHDIRKVFFFKFILANNNFYTTSKNVAEDNICFSVGTFS